MKPKMIFVLSVGCLLVSLGLLFGLTLNREKVLAWGFQEDMELVKYGIEMQDGEDFSATIPHGKIFVLTGLCWDLLNEEEIELYENNKLIWKWHPGFTPWGQVFYTGLPFKGGTLFKIKVTDNYPPVTTKTFITIVGHLIEDRGKDSGMFKK